MTLLPNLPKIPKKTRPSLTIDLRLIKQETEVHLFQRSRQDHIPCISGWEMHSTLRRDYNRERRKCQGTAEGFYGDSAPVRGVHGQLVRHGTFAVYGEFVAFGNLSLAFMLCKNQTQQSGSHFLSFYLIPTNSDRTRIV